MYCLESIDNVGQGLHFVALAVTNDFLNSLQSFADEFREMEMI